MTVRGIAKRRGVQDVPDLESTRPQQARSSSYFTPPPSRSSEPAYRRPELECNDEVPLEGRTSGRVVCSDVNVSGHLEHDSTFFDRNDDIFYQLQNSADREDDEAQDTGRKTRPRSRDDYGIAYSFYQEDDLFSLPDTPEDDRASLEWDSTFDPFTSSSIRRGSLVLDPAAFDSTPSVNTTPQSPGGSTAIRLRRSAEALRDFGKKVLPRLRLKTRHSDGPEPSEAVEAHSSPQKTHRPTGSASTSNTMFSGRTRSNTVESARSSRSVRSKRSSANLNNVCSSANDSPTTYDTSDFLPGPPLLADSLRPIKSLGCPTPFAPCQEDPLELPRMSASGGPTGSLPPVIERDHLSAPIIEEHIPKMASQYNATVPILEEIMRQMQEEDQAFALTEQSMRSSGWSSENDIQELRQRREEQQNLWQRKLDDALDQVKARVNLD